MSTDIAKPSGTSTYEAETAGARAAKAASAVKRSLEKARGYVQGAVGQTRGKMAGYREHGWGHVRGDVVEWTRSRPLAALGVAAAIGLLVGWLSSRTRH